MVAWFERMAPRERAALMAWASAVVMAGGLALGYGRAPQDCFYSPEDFARCDPWRAIGALGDVVATALIAAALWITRNSATTRLHRAARAAGAVGLVVAVAGNLGALFGDAYVIARPTATIGFSALGFALYVESDQGNPLVRSRLGVVVGITLALWAVAYVSRDDQILPTGGAFFFVPYVTWAFRLGYRLGTGRAPSPQQPRSLPTRLLANGAVVVLFFLAFPFWLSSTFGVASIGDPSNLVTVKNSTGEPIYFYEYRRETAYRERIETGETKAWYWLESSAYSPAAEDLAGKPIFCANLRDRELRRAHYLITVVRDPATCESR